MIDFTGRAFRVPAGLPTLAAVPVMEYVERLAAQIHPSLAALARTVDDVPAEVVCRLIGTGERSTKIDQGMDVWLTAHAGSPSPDLLAAAVAWYHQLAGHASVATNTSLTAKLG